MSSLRIGIFAFLGGVILFAHDGIAEGFSFSHKDWELVCDNTRTCRAAGYQADGDERLVSMLLTREAGPNMPVSMELQLDDKGKTADVRAQVGELIISSLAVSKIPQKEAAKLLSVMPDEEKMILTAGDKQWKLSLAGLKAMLLKMDDKQGRIGTPGALIAKGTKPEQQVLPPVPIKTVAVSVVPPTNKEDEKVLAALKDFLDAECDASQTAKDACKTERRIERLSEDKLLITLLIDRAAYNQTIAVWIVNDKPPYNPTPAIEGGLVYNSSKESAVEVLQSTGILESSARGREMADCWNWASWAWTGKYFEKANESSTGMCRGFSSGAWSLPTFVSEVVDEYKAPSGGWKFIVKQDKINRRTGDSSVVTAVSPEGKYIHIDDGIRNAEVKWINGETIEIIDKCGLLSECRYVYFYDIHRGLSRVFSDAITYSIEANLIACPSYNEKKKRIEIIVSEIYTNKKEPISVIYRKWSDQWTDWVVMFLDKQAINKGFFIDSDKIHLEYVEKESEEIKKEDISFDREPPFVVCNDSSKDGGEIEYCSIAEDDYKKGYIWFAAEQPPVGMIDTPKESPLCYRFPSFGLDWQLQKLKDKHGAALYDEKITKKSDGSSSLSVKRKDETDKEIVYFYFDNPKSCAEYQAKRLGDTPPVPYYDYDGCMRECYQYTTWTANEKVILRKDHSDSSPAVATIEAKEEVDELAGVVITKQPRKIKTMKDITMDCGASKLSFKRGEYIYLLNSKGEFLSVWRNGQLNECVFGEDEDETTLQEVNEELSEWWLKISTKDGKTGWTREIKKIVMVTPTNN